MKNFKIKSIEDDNVNVETLSIKRTVGDPIAVEDSTYLFEECEYNLAKIYD